MTNRTTETFWKLFERLPADIQDLAKKNYDLFQVDPQHPSLQLKKQDQTSSGPQMGSSHLRPALLQAM